MLAVLILTLFILGGAGIIPGPAERAVFAHCSAAGPHGLSEMLYAWTSATENNGSAMAGPHRGYALCWITVSASP